MIQVCYKEVAGIKLHLNIYQPLPDRFRPHRPAIVYFFGGGWVKGDVKQFKTQAEYMAQKGIVGITVEYRIKSIHNTLATMAVKDARSALRFIKKNAVKYNIDPDKVYAAGGSAGGHLALSTAMLDHINGKFDDLSIDPTPRGILLYNPVVNVDNFADRFAGPKRADEANPMNYVKINLPPTLIFHGSEDDVIPLEDVREFKSKMQRYGNHCELKIYDGVGHGFYNRWEYNRFYYYSVLDDSFIFIRNIEENEKH